MQESFLLQVTALYIRGVRQVISHMNVSFLASQTSFDIKEFMHVRSLMNVKNVKAFSHKSWIYIVASTQLRSPMAVKNVGQLSSTVSQKS